MEYNKHIMLKFDGLDASASIRMCVRGLTGLLVSPFHWRTICKFSRLLISKGMFPKTRRYCLGRLRAFQFVKSPVVAVAL